MNYTGEHLLPGQMGHFFVVLSFVSSLLATIGFILSANASDPVRALSWKKFARRAFVADALSILAIFIIIYWMIAQHYFEYYYVWNHSDRSLEPKYLLSSIWEGQEGSFLLWAFWQAVLGLLIMRGSGTLTPAT